MQEDNAPTAGVHEAMIEESYKIRMDETIARIERSLAQHAKNIVQMQKDIKKSFSVVQKELEKLKGNK